jgi:phospholipase/lecithinase/hemolysin
MAEAIRSHSTGQAYWDNIHPTSRVQAMWAQGFAATVPEPATLTLFGLGLLILLLVARREHRKPIRTGGKNYGVDRY